MAPTRTKLNEMLKRHAETPVRTALGDTRIVALVGPRQSGKTTLARKLAAEEGMVFVTLDDIQHRQFATSDPTWRLLAAVGTGMIFDWA